MESKTKRKKPLLFFINVSGGGLRSATFVMNALQKLDSLSNGEITNHTFLISGASGECWRLLITVSYAEKNKEPAFRS